jgi:hypothetical protein
MTRASQKAAGKVIRSWKKAKAQLERWRREGTSVRVELKRPRVIDDVPIDFLRGEPVQAAREGTRRFRGRLIHATRANITIRRPSGGVLVIDRGEITALSDGKRLIKPAAGN